MIEVFMLMFLKRRIRRVAEERGRDPNSFKWLTIALWFGFEIAGFVFLMIAGWDIDLVWIPALLCGMAGGALAYLIVKTCKRGTYVRPERKVIDVKNMERLPGAQLLPKPRPVKIVREDAFLGSMSSYKVSFNGQKIGKIENEDYILINTPYTQNVVTIQKKHFYFSIPPYPDDQMPEIYFKSNAFLPDRCVNCQRLDPTVMKLK